MASRGSLVPSNYPSQHEQPNIILQSASRRPLTASAGNSKLQLFAQDNLYHDHKEYRHGSERTMYAIPTVVPSLPSARQSLGHTWEQRRQRHRTSRQSRYTRNPLANSPPYLAYRARQNREGNPDDAKWPEVLELAFLDALVYIPYMGRQKYSYRGKAHGRNELIREYIWLSYLRSLPPGQPPDPAMRRCRKQVSSHIQVLKTFFKDHPAYHTLFPQNKGPKNGFDHSFKNDPCLRALSEGRLPDQSPEDFATCVQTLGMTATPQGETEPNVFWLFITSSSIPTDPSGRSTTEEELYQSGLVAHKYTSLSSQRPRDSIESISNWRARFPRLFHLYTISSLNCEIIYMDVALSLMTSHPPEGAELVSRTEISIRNSEHDQETNLYLNNSTWRITTTLSKPAELCRDPAVDPIIDNQTSIIPVLSMNAQQTRIKVPFPAMAWAHAFTSLTDLSQRPASLSGLNASSLLDEISMFQEVQCSPGPRRPFQRRAIILWTFRKSRDGESSCTTWRYVDPGSPSRHDCMSPDPGHSERLNADMSENFNTSFMAGTLENTVMDPFIQSHSQQQQIGLETPLATAGLLSPFGAHQQSVYGVNGLGIETQFSIPGDNLSFESAATVDSESTLVESDVAGNLESFIVNSNAGIELAGFDSGHQSWGLDGGSDSNAIQSFDSSNSNWAYSALQNASNSATPHLGGWEDIGTGNSKGDVWIAEEVSKRQEWTESGVEQRVKELEWVVELPAQDDEDRVWEVTECEDDIAKPTSTKVEANAAELDEEGYETVSNWVEERHDHHESVDELSNLNDLRPTEHGTYSPSPPPGTKEGEWEALDVTDGDGFDYTQLTERLK